jgi:chitin synthase
LHDVSWGTKGDNGASKALGSAKKVVNKDGQDMYEVELPTVSEYSLYSGICLIRDTGSRGR